MYYPSRLPLPMHKPPNFEPVPDPIDASWQCCLVHTRSWRQRKLEHDLRFYSWLSETHERERIADLGEVVSRAVVNISPHRFIFGPSHAIREADLASHRHLAAHLAHVPYCSSHGVSIVEIERRKACREWRAHALHSRIRQILEEYRVTLRAKLKATRSQNRET